jgi:phosphatidate phosphatase PAH1
MMINLKDNMRNCSLGHSASAQAGSSDPILQEKDDKAIANRCHTNQNKAQTTGAFCGAKLGSTRAPKGAKKRVKKRVRKRVNRLQKVTNKSTFC